jgi:hypothetical protein
VPDEFLTVNEVAELLKLNQQTIRNSIGASFRPSALARGASASANRSWTPSWRPASQDRQPSREIPGSRSPKRPAESRRPYARTIAMPSTARSQAW